MSTNRALSIVCAAALSLSLIAGSIEKAHAGVYAGNKCVSDKLKAAGKKCKTILKAWSGWDDDQDDGSRDADLAAAALKFSESWAKANDKALGKGVDCADTTLSDTAMETLIDDAVVDIVNAVNAGLNLTNDDDGKCGAAILKAASAKCDKFLKAESTFIKKLDKDPTGAARDETRDAASTKFSAAWASATAGGCPTTATEAGIEEMVDELSDAVVENTTVSPNVDDTQFTTITPSSGILYEKRTLNPICSKNSPYHFFVKRGSTNKLLMYYQGGGACWNFLTCGLIGTFDDDVNPTGSDNPNNTSVGLAAQSNPLNPFAEWNIVFVPYCTGDVHWGDSEQTYFGGGLGTQHIEHRGYVNAKVAEKWAREHFVNPEEIFVTGSSAGAYGALLHGTLLHVVYPASKINTLADAGNGVITPAFLANNFPRWNVEPNIPTYIPGLDVPIGSLSIPDMTEAVAAYYPESNWGHYTSAYDGGTGGQTGFYHVMLHDTNSVSVAQEEWPNWWETSCAWEDAMRSQAQSTTAPNYRYYIGSGSRHTMFGDNKVYSELNGPDAITVVDWINAMRDDTPAWTNVDCVDVTTPGSQPDGPSECGLLNPGDPAGPPKTCTGGANAHATCTVNSECPGGTCDDTAYQPSGPDTVVVCP